jgi:hypothetical protein
LVLERQLPVRVHDEAEHAERELSERGLGDQLLLGELQCGGEAGGGDDEGELLCDEPVRSMGDLRGRAEGRGDVVGSGVVCAAAECVRCELLFGDDHDGRV